MVLRKRGYLREEFNNVRAVNLLTNAIARGGYNGHFVVRNDRSKKGVDNVWNVPVTKKYASFEFMGSEDKIHVITDPDDRFGRKFSSGKAVYGSREDHGVVSNKKAIEIIQNAISKLAGEVEKPRY
jgi:peroxiredoxin